MRNSNYHFQSIGESAFINQVRESLRAELPPSRWKLGGGASLTAAFLSIGRDLECKHGRGLVAQIWMECPSSGRASCKFEIAKKIEGKSQAENLRLREQIAKKIRDYLYQSGLPDGVAVSTRSTVPRFPVELPGINVKEDDLPDSVSQYSVVIQKVVQFCVYLDVALSAYNSGSATFYPHLASNELLGREDIPQIDEGDDLQI
jgi:hypothetical protein